MADVPNYLALEISGLQIILVAKRHLVDFLAGVVECYHTYPG